MNASTNGWQASFLSVLPAIETHARIQFRRLSPNDREEAVQEAIASACASYQLLAAKGKLDVAKPGTLASYAVSFVRNSRHVGGHQDAARDALSPVAQRRHRFSTTSYDYLDEETGAWRQLAIADRNDSIPDVAAFRLDFARWLKTLARRDRRIIAALIRRERSLDIAQRFHMSPGRVSQLRRRYERDWSIYQGEALSDAA